ncbi:PQQ-binding-like beta-propeller repeat protein [Streptomyces sp. NPDC046332]|uniref:outer membrane protein assembly factor BamB family protein n=1 Tax=unclassified Streptomyces TaxID=2593676 RepID=UPI0033EF4B8F
MTQPPSNQPPGFGAPNPDPNRNPDPNAAQNPAQGPPQGPPPMPPQAPPMPPQAPPVPPQAPQAPAPQTPPPAAPGPYNQPPQPGYGYPQQQPGPYNQPPQAGYGYPQQPGPYGQQPGPYGQQPGPYGGGYPAPAPAPGGKNPFKGKPAVIVAAAVAAALVIGGGTWFALSGDGEDEPVAKPTATSETPKPSESIDQGDGSGDGGGRNGEDDLNAGRKPGEAKINWLLKNNVDLPRNGADVFGPWVVGDVVAKAMYKGISGYALGDGASKWHLDLPFEVCAAAPEPAADGTTVIGINDKAGDRADCTVLQQVNLKTGKAGWKKTLDKGTGFSSLSDITLAISGGTVTAAGTNNSWGFSLSDGKQLFGKPATGQCQPYAFAGGAKLIAAASCRTSDVNKKQEQISEVDPNTGKPRWTFKLQPNWEVDKVYSVNPLVVSAQQRDEKKWTVFAVTPDGKLRSQIQGGNDKYAPDCGGGAFVIFGRNLQGCQGVAADANTFYMATDSEYRQANAVVAFDLNTGKQKWRAAAPAERSITPLRMEGSEVVVYMKAMYDKGGAVATIAPTGGTPKILQQHPLATAEIEDDYYNPAYVYSGGTFVVAAGRVSARNDAEEKETKTMMAFSK